MVVLVEVARKAYLASIVPVIVNAILNEHQVIVDIVAFVNRGDFPRSRLGEKQRGKILAGWVSRKMRTMAQFAIRDMADIDGGDNNGGSSNPAAGTLLDANRTSLGSMRSGGGSSNQRIPDQSSMAPPQILEQRELEQQHDQYPGGGDNFGGPGTRGAPQTMYGAVEMPVDGRGRLGDGHPTNDGVPTSPMANNGYDNNDNDVRTPTQARVGMLSVRNADSNDSDDDPPPPSPPPASRKPVVRKGLHSPQHPHPQHLFDSGVAGAGDGYGGANTSFSATGGDPSDMYLPGVDGRPSMNNSWRLSTAMYSSDGTVFNAGGAGAGAGAGGAAGGQAPPPADDWTHEAIRGLNLADNLDKRA